MGKVFVFMLNILFTFICSVPAIADQVLPSWKSPDGKYLATGRAGLSESGNQLRVKDIATDKVLFENADKTNFYVKPIGFASNSRFIYETCINRCNEYSESNTYYTIVDTGTWEEVAVINPGLYSVASLSKMNSDRLFIANKSKQGNNLKLYNLNDGKLLNQYRIGPAKAAIASMDEKFVLALMEDSDSAKLVNVENGTISTFSFDKKLGNAAFSPTGNVIAFGFEGYAAAYDMTSRNILKKYPVDVKGDCSGNCSDNLGKGTMKFSQNGRLLAAASESGVTYVWNAASGERLWKLRLPEKERNILSNKYRFDSDKIPHNARFSSDEKEVLVSFGSYTKAFSLIDGTELGELQDEKRRILTTQAKNFEPRLQALGITKRVGFKSGDIRERYVPPVTNSHYNTETLYYVGSTPVTKTTSSTYTNESYKEKVSGFTAIYELRNSSKTNYIVDILLDGTVKNSNWKTYNPWFGDNFRDKKITYEHLTVNKRILLKAGASLKDQIVVGEEEPSSFTVGVIDVTPVDASWISGLDKALGASIKNKKLALEILPVLEKYISDPLTKPWSDKLKTNKENADRLLASINQADMKKHIAVSLQTQDDYDPDFANEVNVTISNSGANKYGISISMADGQKFTVQVMPRKSINKKVSVKNIAKDKLKAVIDVVEMF